ncbi:MAG: hypothetical protein LBJ64_11700 [Deltaproteobacteria bacterium]|jgi:hypothetical protein|nr:hypothetical protein [Deltaproteobacteria bacterium]
MTRKRANLLSRKGTISLYVKELDNKEARYALCRHPSDGDPAMIRKAGAMRWTIEQSFKELKSGVGMDQRQVRSYPGWRRHALTAHMACQFLPRLSLDNCDDSNVRRKCPIVEKPVTLEECLEADENMQKDAPIENPNLKERPSSPQQIFTPKIHSKGDAAISDQSSFVLGRWHRQFDGIRVSVCLSPEEQNG